MSGIPENILRKVRALLAKADGAATEHEGWSYTAKATELMARHSIDQAMIGDQQGDAEEPEVKTFRVEGPWVLLKAQLLGCIAQSLGCKALRAPKSSKAVPVAVYGYPTDIHRVEVLYASLLLQMANGAENARPPQGVQTRKFRQGWMLGFAQRVGERLAEIEKATAQDATPTRGRGAELVLQDRAQVVERFMRQQTTGGIRREGLTQGDRQGRRSGALAADRADLNQDRVGARKALGA